MMSSHSPRAFSAFELRPGETYQVIKPFLDYTGTRHEVGERWVFVRHSFLPYEDGLTLTVVQDGLERGVLLQCRPEAQAAVVNAFSEYVAEV
jgi:hypothetical protein